MNDFNAICFEHLKVLAKGYTTGDFSELFERLADDCVWESMDVLYPRTGYEVVKAYYEEKGKLFIQNNSCPQTAIIVELDGNLNMESDITDEQGKSLSRVGLLYNHGELCLYMEQKLENETATSLVRITLNSDYKIRRIDMCEPSFFSFRRYGEK